MGHWNPLNSDNWKGPNGEPYNPANWPASSAGTAFPNWGLAQASGTYCAIEPNGWENWQLDMQYHRLLGYCWYCGSRVYGEACPGCNARSWDRTR